MRRSGKKGLWLFSDDYTGITQYSSKAKQDYWGNTVVQPLIRNLQEIASPLSDPYPVPFSNAGCYEATNACDFETQPIYVGNTTVRTKPSDATYAMGLDPAIPDAAIGCTFIVH